MTPGKLQFAWRAAVGPALARASSVELRGARVVVHMSSPEWAREIERSRPITLQRLRPLLGRDVITRIDLM